MTFLANDAVIGRSLKTYGEWAENEIALLSGFLKRDAFVVDAGANIGTHALAFAQYAGPGGAVLAFEPEPVLCALLRRNVEDNRAECVTANCCGLSDRRELLYVSAHSTAQPANFGATKLLRVVPEQAEARAVQAVPLDEFHLQRCDLIKADVEGMELSLLQGAVETLERCKPVLYLECNTVAGALELFAHLQRKPYRLYLHKSPTFNPNNFFGSRDQIFGTACESAILAVPVEQDENCAARLASDFHVAAIRSADHLRALLAEAQLVLELREGLAHAEQLATGRQAEIVSLSAALAEAQKLVEARERLIQQLECALADLEGLTADHAGEVRRYAAALGHAQELVAEREAQIRLYDVALGEAQRLVAERENHLAELRTTLGDSEARNAELDRALMSWRQQLDEVDRDRASLKARLEAVEHSLLWRVLKPFYRP